MKTLFYLIWIPAFAGMTLLMSCKDNTVMGPTNGNPPSFNDSLMFSFDSAACISNPHSLFRLNHQFDTCLNKLRTEFTLETNDTSQSVEAHISVRWLTTQGLATLFGLFYSGDSCNGTYNVNFTLNRDSAYTGDSVYTYEALIGKTQSASFICLKNVKLYKVN